MSRFFGFGNIRKFGHAVLASQRIQSSAVKRHGPLVTVGSSSSLLRFYSHYGCCSRGHASFTLFRAKNSLYRDQCLKNNTIAHHAQVAWKRLSQICSYSGPSFPPISKIACAVSLALTRSNLVAPSIVAFILGEMAGTKKTWADAQPLPRRDVLYRQAQDGHVYFTRFMFSILEGLILIFRAIYLTVLFSPTITMAPFANCLGVQFRKTWIHLVHLTLEKAGPAFIKWGQWAATRPDLFPKDLCIELSKLHTKAPSHSFAYTKKTIEKAFSRKLNDVFDDFEEKPIASGSIAQIHRATLKFRYPGQQVKPIVVAVKVRHPGVGESIRRDFVIIDLVAKFSNFIPTLQWLRLDESVQQFAVFMLSQVDLVREAHNLSRFIYNFRKWKDVSFPKPLYPLVHSAVLVETYEPGESVSRYVDDELECTTKVKCDLAHTGTQAFLQMVLKDNFIHADMHPGNLLVREPQKKSSRKGLFKSKPHVIFLDVGMTAELSKSDQVNLQEFFKSVAIRNGSTAARCLLGLSERQNCPNPKAFIEEVEKSFRFWGTPEGAKVHPADCMHQLLEQVRRHKVNINGNVCTIMVTTLVLEGWQRKLDPKYNIMQTLQKLLVEHEWPEPLNPFK